MRLAALSKAAIERTGPRCPVVTGAGTGTWPLERDSEPPQVYGSPGLDYAKASDEHRVLEVAAAVAAPRLGDRLWLIPGHCDPTVNLYDWMVGLRGETVERVWAVAARGALV